MTRLHTCIRVPDDEVGNWEYHTVVERCAARARRAQVARARRTRRAPTPAAPVAGPLRQSIPEPITRCPDCGGSGMATLMNVRHKYCPNYVTDLTYLSD